MLKIIVKSKDENSNINLNIPISLVIIGLRLGKPFINDKHIYKYCKFKEDKVVLNDKNTKEMINGLIKGLKYLKKNHKGLVLVDIEDSNGDIVKIQI